MTNRSTWIAFVLALGLAASVAEAKPGPEKPRSRRGFNLLSSAELPMTVNNVFCGINNLGEVCVALAGSAVSGGGVWPKGTPDQYIFNSGLQVAAIIPPGQGPWGGDTVGAYFMDPRGTQAQGEGLTPVYSSLDPADAAAWPAGGVARDPSLFNSVLLGRNTVSQQDIWFRTWDGNPSLLSGRTHPMGVAVDIRGMGWNYPSGNEDNLYFIYTFYNITASDPAKYSTLNPAIRDEIAAIGQKFQDGVKARLGVTLPAGGYRFDSLYAAFFMDPDVGDATANYSTAILPFNLGIAYKSDFREADWTFPANIFGAPFAPAPGFVGVKYLQSPKDSAGNEVGLTMFSNTLNSTTGFPDPVGVIQLWRYLSGNVSPARGDNSCNQDLPREHKLCFLFSEPEDTRFFQASGPFSLDPGKSATIVVAYVHGAPVAAALGTNVGGDVPPEVPPSGDSLVVNPAAVRLIDKIAGWVSQSDTGGAVGGGPNGRIEQEEVKSVPRSLLDKSMVAQAVFDNKFLLPFAPEAPTFHLIPGDNQVSIVWTKSNSESTGDPYYDVASNPANASLYDPNFRRFDVEGYRIYRGRTTGQLEMIAQFDYSGTTFVDATGNLAYPNHCAPELGLDAAADSTNPTGCPVDFGANETNTVSIVSPFVQVKNGDRVLLADSTVLTLRADSAVTGGNSGFPALDDAGVPFAFIDHGVRNSFTYYYAVTAFDVNSVKSGPSSLESARITKSATPRAAAPNQVDAVLVSGLQGDDNQILDPLAAWSIDPVTGKFSGTPPPTNTLTGVFAPLVPALLPTLNLTAKIDSLIPHSQVDFPGCAGKATGGATISGPGYSSCFEVFVTFDKNGTKTQFSQVVLIPTWSSFGEVESLTVALGSQDIDADPAAAARFGVPAGFSKFQAKVGATLYQSIAYSSFEGQAARRQGSGGIPSQGGSAVAGAAAYSPGGSRWFSGTNETANHPTTGIRVGVLPGTDTVWAPIHHVVVTPGGATALPNSGTLQFFGYLMSQLGREADVEFTWGANGVITGVRDLTHHVAVPFKPTPQGSYGFVGDNNGNGRIDYQDFFWLKPMQASFNANVGIPAAAVPIASQPVLQANPVIMPVTTDAGIAAQAGSNGFGLYVNGERYIIRLTGGNPPASGTKWTLRTYSGFVSASNANSAAPTNYTYSPRPRPALIPGLQVAFKVQGATSLADETDSTLALVHTVPDPYYVTTSLEATTNTKILKFVNLPPKAVIRIYSVSGVLVQVLTHNDPNFGGEETWNLRSRNNQFVASGVYFYHVESASGKTKAGRFTVVNFAQ